MMYLNDTLWIERRKAMRSKMPLFTALGFMIMPVMSTFLIFINNNPQVSRKLGLISAKAEMFGSATDWQGYLSLVTQTVAVGGFFLFLPDPQLDLRARVQRRHAQRPVGGCRCRAPASCWPSSQ